MSSVDADCDLWRTQPFLLLSLCSWDVELSVECRNRDVGFNMCSQRVFVERAVEDAARHTPISPCGPWIARMESVYHRSTRMEQCAIDFSDKFKVDSAHGAPQLILVPPLCSFMGWKALGGP